MGRDRPVGETTAIAFQSDPPDACAPQAVLVAVPPVPGGPWTVAGLSRVLVETLDSPGCVRSTSSRSARWLTTSRRSTSRSTSPAMRCRPTSVRSRRNRRPDVCSRLLISRGCPPCRRSPAGPDSNRDTGIRHAHHGGDARVFDPLWMLTRQWQVGEFHAADTRALRSVARVRADHGTALALSSWAPATRHPDTRPPPTTRGGATRGDGGASNACARRDRSAPGDHACSRLPSMRACTSSHARSAAVVGDRIDGLRCALRRAPSGR